MGDVKKPPPNSSPACVRRMMGVCSQAKEKSAAHRVAKTKRVPKEKPSIKPWASQSGLSMEAGALAAYNALPGSWHHRNDARSDSNARAAKERPCYDHGIFSSLFVS